MRNELRRVQSNSFSFLQCVRGTWACVTSKPSFTSPPLYRSRLNRAFLGQKHPPGPDLGKDDRGAEAIPIDMGPLRSEPRQDLSVGDKEDFGIYAELGDSDGFRASLFYIRNLGSHP
jgi:hypothetical protein